MLEYRLTIEEALLLIESLDSTHKTEFLHKISDNDEYQLKHGITNHRIYSLDNGSAGQLDIFHRNGAYEIHHTIQDEKNNSTVSGSWVPSGKHNAKFVGTMYRVAKNILGSNNSVRVVGNHTNGMFDHYNRMAAILAKRHGYIVSVPKPYNFDSDNAKDYSEITISSHNKNTPMNEMAIARTYSNKKENNYGLNNSSYKQFSSIEEMVTDYFNK